MTLAKRLWGGLFLAVFVASCAQAPSPTTPPSTRAVTPLSSGTPTPYGGNAAHLGPLPKNCPASPSRVTKTDHGGVGEFYVPAGGMAPVWIRFFGGVQNCHL